MTERRLLLADFVAKVGFELGDDGVSDLSLGDCASPGRLLPGGLVLWQATNAGHNAVFVLKGFPEGAKALDGMMSKDVSYTFEKPGIYMIKCNPRYGLGMLQAVIVGNDLSNLDQVKAANYPGKAKPVADAIFAELSKG